MKTIKPQLSIEQVRTILQPQFKYLAKSYGEPLWLHSFSVWSILSKIAVFIPRLTDRERLLMELAALLHDIGKMRPGSQEILTKARGGPLKHTATKEEVRNYISPFISSGLLELTDKDISSIWEFALHHHLSDGQIKEASVPSFGIYGEIVRFSDWLSSMEYLNMPTIMRITNTLREVCKMTVFGVGRYPSPATSHVLQIAVDRYRSLCWEVLLILDNGVVFIGDMDACLPKKSEIVKEFSGLLMEGLFEGHSIQPLFLKYEILSGIAAEDPVDFLDCRKDSYIEKLGNAEEAGVIFLRTLVDLYKKSGELSKVRKLLSILDILAMAGGPNGIGRAKELWNKRNKTMTQWVSTKEFINDIFNNVYLSEVIPYTGEEEDRKLSALDAGELFNVLRGTALKFFKDKKVQNISEVVDSLILMEEETDFEKIAKKSLEHYKNYKQSRRPGEALCEHCGATITWVATSSLNFPTRATWTGFTQINPNPNSGAPRVVCPLCVFDATKLRSKNLGAGKSQIFVRISSRVPELWQIYKDLKDCILRLYQSVTNVQEIKSLCETEFSNLPLPPKFDIPVKKKYQDTSFSMFVQTERGVLFALDTVSIDTSPKDLRAKFLAIYALLNLMGFDSQIGLEEQEGLFGAKIFQERNEDWLALYYEGLVINILATKLAHTKRKNVHIFAQNLVEKSPSILLCKLEEVEIKKELLEKVILFLLRINTKSFNNGGVRSERNSGRCQVFCRKYT